MNGGATSIIYSTFRRQIVSGGADGSIVCTDTRQLGGIELWSVIKAHNSAITTLTMDPWEQTLVSGAADGEIKLWDLTTHTHLMTVNDSINISPEDLRK